MFWFTFKGGISINELDNNQWYYIKYTQKTGPFNRDEIFDLYIKNEIDEGTFLWRRGIKEWTKIEDIPDLNKLILQPPPVDIGTKNINSEQSVLMTDIESDNSPSSEKIQIDKIVSKNEYPYGRP